MKLSSLLTVSAIVAGLFGVALVLFTAPLLLLYGIALSGAGSVVAQLFGSALVGFAVLNWFGRSIQEAKAQQAIVLANLVGDAVGFVMSLLGQLAGVANALGWSTVAIYLILTLGFAYFQFMKPRAA